ncbi:MAG: DsbA family protein [Desulfobacterales bacterium]|nr:DsbA family protein [Desulfobacterales bacterium]
MTKREIIYVGDPMCAWCFGFAPVLDALMTEFQSEATFRFIMGGLRVDNPIAITPEIRPALQKNWNGVTRTTGQVIHGHLLDEAPEFLYDSFPASRAFVTVRTLAEEMALPYYKALHEAFYLHLTDITNHDELCRIALPLGIDEGQFKKRVDSASIHGETRQDFSTTVTYNVQAFPALVLKEGEHAAILNQGYKPFETLAPHIRSWIKGELKTSQITPALLIFGRL